MVNLSGMSNLISPAAHKVHYIINKGLFGTQSGVKI